MPRQDRLDFKGAIHYARLRGGDGSAIFFDPGIFVQHATPPRQHAPHLQRFERLITAAAEECQVVLHGYSVEPNSAILVLQTNGPPLEAFMRRLCGQHSRYLRTQGHLSSSQCVFASRYESKIVAPEYLPHAVRRAHRSPILAGLCASRMDYPFSSERAYMGERAALPLETHDVRRALELRGLFGMRGYREFMDSAETLYVADLFNRGAALDSRIIGGKIFVQRCKDLIAHPPDPPTREQIISGVAHLMKASEAEIYASTHVGVLGRALVAWYAHRAGAATLTDVGKWFEVTGATLGQGIRHYRLAAPELFKLTALPDLDAAAARARNNFKEDEDHDLNLGTDDEEPDLP